MTHIHNFLENYLLLIKKYYDIFLQYFKIVKSKIKCRFMTQYYGCMKPISISPCELTSLNLQ